MLSKLGPPDRPDPSTLLQVRGLAKAFGGVRAVRSLDLDVEEGTIVAVIGPNGAGKSTAVDLISGFKRADAGSITFAGHRIERLPAYRVARLGLMRTFQASREWSRLTVMDNMLVAVPQMGSDTAWRALFTRGKLRRKDTADRIAARDLLAYFGLMSVRDEYAGNLSGGQKRLLEFARIAMAHPRMLILDEPLAGVNPVLQDEILRAVQRLNEDGITIMLIEHNLPWVESATDRIVVMAEGANIAAGTMAEISAHEVVVTAYLGEVVVRG